MMDGRGPECGATRRLTASNRRNDANFVSFIDFGGTFFEKSDVFIVYEDIDKPADITGFIANPLTQSREGGIQVFEDFIDGCPFDGYDILVAGEFSQWSWDSYSSGHMDWVWVGLVDCWMVTAREP